MFNKSVSILAVLLFLILLSPIVHAETIVYLCQDGLAGEINMDSFLSQGQIEVLTGQTVNQKAQPGPAPAPYPSITIWEQGIEQLGKDFTTVDAGLQFTGQNWSPGSRVLVLWKIRVYNPSMRMPDEFKDDLNLALWVDWNQDGMWSKDEKMVCTSFNIHDLFPTNEDHLEIRYLSWFDITDNTNLFKMLGNNAPATPNKSEKSVWIRGLLSYDDPDASPDGNCLFGEYEDYLVTYKVITPASL
jgi:hypothetical protein